METKTTMQLFSENMHNKSLHQIAQQAGVSRHTMDKVFIEYLNPRENRKDKTEGGNENPHSNGASFHEIVSAIRKEKPSFPSHINNDKHAIPAESRFSFLRV